MKVIIAENYAAQCAQAADIIENVLREKPDCRLGLATGSSPLGIYQELIRRCRDEGLDFSQAESVNLDEYVGLAPSHDQSYRYFMDSNLFHHVNIRREKTFVAQGTGDAEENLRRFRAALAEKTTDIQLLGLGPDGHIGFNEPGSALHCSAHMEELDESTIDANARFFQSRDEVPRRAVTMGMGDIMQARKLLLIISGSNKEQAASALLMDDMIDPACPVTFIKLHRDATVVISRELAEKIGYTA